MNGQARLDHERMTTVWSVLSCHAEQTPDQVATLFEGRSTTYRELSGQAAAVAAALVGQGHNSGDRIGYLGKNSDYYFALFFAVARLGCVLVPLNWRLSEDELAYIVADSEMACLFSDAEFAALAARLVGARGLPHRLLDRAMLEDRSDGAALPAYGVDPQAVVFQVYTSGTTGRPKGAMLTNRNMLALREPGYRAGLDWFPTPGCTIGQVLPVAHIAGTAYALFGFYAGARVVITREFEAGALPGLIAREGISHILLAPAAMQLMLEHPESASADYSSLAYITYGAAPIPEALLRQAIARIGCGFVQMYGMSEAAGGVVALQPADHTSGVPGRLRSAGTAMPGAEIGIVDDDWNLLGADSTGEIVVRSGSVMPGYWKRPDANAEVFGPDGWMRTGDIGRIDADGYLYVLDRAKDMIISGGENVYPAEVENAIFGHPDVADVAVVGAPSARWGEEVVALIVPREGTSPDLASVLAWLDGKLARFKLPKQVVLAQSLPRNAGNKLLRRVLREPFWQGHERRVN
ncbi:long-chain acyl-CoA synthetase [Novosphingobium hassiacum]|uniref:3-methylmercaptopropionyl-CoA ligase n=1 Tax=Novosphingobium hassiacum TaxID=173676 RepID=A0A7W6EXR7_9SPHN|nr:long-chain-fatty-acid--CoA ligase [Novosphingobium hassiacum]MBB3862144.1 long-chain acyl-CoA synthetase [Novosphingobium hassiacum]